MHQISLTSVRRTDYEFFQVNPHVLSLRIEGDYFSQFLKSLLSIACIIGVDINGIILLKFCFWNSRSLKKLMETRYVLSFQVPLAITYEFDSCFLLLLSFLIIMVLSSSDEEFIEAYCLEKGLCGKKKGV